MNLIDEKKAYVFGCLYGYDDYKENTKKILKYHFNDHFTEITEELCEEYRNVDYSMLEGILRLDFLRGFFDNCGKIFKDKISMPVSRLSSEMLEVIDSEHEDGVWYGINGFEFLSQIYYKDAYYFRIETRKFLDDMSNPHSTMEGVPCFNWLKTLENAVEPFKNRVSDTGFDLTIVSKTKEINGVCYYDTGIQVCPPHGFYFEIVGRSSISKTGWMLANNIGIIDASYRGNIIVALVKVNPEAEEIKLPMRIVQLIPRELVIMNALEVKKIEKTTRGDKGFGSSGN